LTSQKNILRYAGGMLGIVAVPDIEKEHVLLVLVVRINQNTRSWNTNRYFLYGEINMISTVFENDVEFFKTHVRNGAAIQIKDTGYLFHMDQPAKTLELIGQWPKK
jgi:hypothetical protein